MSIWTDRIHKHPVFTSLFTADAVIVNAGSKTKDPVAVAAIDRVRSILAYIRARIETIDPLLVSPSLLDNFPPQIDHVTQSLNSFANDQSIAHLDQANSYADPMLSWISNVPVPQGASELRAARTVMNQLRKDTEALLTNVKDLTTDLNKSLTSLALERDELAGQVKATRSEVTTIATDFQRQFSEAQDRRSTEYGVGQQEREKSTRELLQQQSDRFNSAYTAVEEQRKQIFDDSAAELDALEKTIEKRRDQFFVDLAESSKQHTEHLDQKAAEADRIVSLIANRGAISSYQKAAIYFRRLGWIWNGVTVAAILGIVASVISFIASGVDQAGAAIPWTGRLMEHLPLFVALGALATYAGYEAAKAQRGEAENQKLELDLAALGPFLADLDDAQLNEFRLKIADRVFGRPFDPQTISASPATLPAAFLRGAKMDKLIVDLFEAALKAGKA